MVLPRLLSSALFFTLAGSTSASQPSAKCHSDVTYNGLSRNGIEIFLGIKYAQDTSGPNRFKPPKPYVPIFGSKIDATTPGSACPQQLGQWLLPLGYENITQISEDCLNLNVARPKGTRAGAKLPVMVWIHGGSFWVGSNMEPTTAPDGIILESVKNGLPVISVAINYRLGLFGFAQSAALHDEGSLNAGLRDQRLAIEWVRDNIAQFGGDPSRITIHGQSSGGLAIGMQFMAYGGSKPLPFQRGICQSQCLEPGITGNFTLDAMRDIANYVHCNTTSIHSAETVSCLRGLDTQTLFNASSETRHAGIENNIGDIWLPAVDGDFLPAPPSQLIREGRLGKATMMGGWADGDLNFFTDFSISSENAAFSFISTYGHFLPPHIVNKLLSLYPSSEFTPPPSTNLTAEFYRTARIFRDIVMACEPLLLGEAMHKAGNDVYLYDFNQTILEPILESATNVSNMGVIHTTEFAYIWGNLSAYDVLGNPFNPTPSDYALQHRASRTWSTFASLGRPSLKGKDTVQGFKEAYSSKKKPEIFVIGGPGEGLSTREMQRQKLNERCAFINSPEVIGYLQF
ncbi:putative lipase [Delitschia confertaspora ATCC 74209]|uniref:Carboxylic ester hydrolase n=1 Tax=Delitschia confertaspora ATCC 74209 TaxID=1513339 RepID=A0A9P4JGI3_9PLEO|nr:putative lipase [Delitschia confertaspora ATCC 74209]